MAGEKPTTRNLKKYKRSPDFTPLYVNNVNFAFTPIDIQMMCSRTVASMDTESDYVEEIATIIMTPQHAVGVLESLAIHIARYEAAHGKIIIPENLQSLPPTKEQQVLASAARRKKK